MHANHSKSAFLHEEVRRKLQSGRYLPGQRINPGALAAEYKISPTPVRLALFCLVGERMIVDRGSSGLYVPMPTEADMRDLYGGMHLLLQVACDIGFAPDARENVSALRIDSPEYDLVKLTWQLFDGIAYATTNRFLHQIIKQTNDRLAPIRRAKQGLIESSFEELSELNRLWQELDTPALKSALHAYHDRRKALVPDIVTVLAERQDHVNGRRFQSSFPRRSQKSGG